MAVKTESNKKSMDREFVITRVFDAPRERVFKAWTESDHLTQWWGPKGFTVLSCKVDLRPGGVMHYCLRGPDGRDMWGKFVYRDIVKPERLVFVNSFSDEKGGVTRHPLAPDWPLEMLSTVTFAEQDGRTKLIVQWVPLNATESERQAFEAGRSSMEQGWTGTLDNLANYLAKA